MAGAKMFDIHGKVKYIHAVGFSKFDKWTITLIPDEKSLTQIKDWIAEGLKNKLQKNELNEYVISFHREPKRKGKNGILIAQTMPKVVDKNGVLMDGNRVGWGSDVTVRLEVYRNTPTSVYKFIAARWDSLRVDELIEWQADRDLGPAEAAEVKSLTEAEKAAEPW